jgi:glucose/arabinose dehydrogenase
MAPGDASFPGRNGEAAMQRRVFLAGVGAALASPGLVRAGTMSSSAGRLQVETVATGLDEPWAVGFLPEGGALVTLRGGGLLAITGGRARPVGGLPAVYAGGQGGLLDLMIPRDFARSRTLFLSYAKPQDGRGGAGTALARAVYADGAGQLTGLRDIFEMTPGSSGGRHFGSRIVEAPDGRLFLTIGDRGDRPSAQDLARHNGAVLCLNRDGSVPADNPFVGQPGARPEIWSYGHRNPQGATLDARGRLWITEHGARGGDEVNLVERGVNYGWPVISYGRHYSGLPIGEGTARPGMAQPAHYWDPSIAPSGLAVHDGRLWPEWRGHLFAGSLKFDYIARLDPARGFAEERLEADETGRVRDVRQGPDGAIWFLSVTNGSLNRIVPG